MNRMAADDLAPIRIITVMLIVFALTAVIISAVGLYGIISYVVAQRTPEFAIRIALGATSSAILYLVLRDAARLVAGGLAVGMIGAVGFGRLASFFLYGVGANDPATVAAVGVILAGVAVLASYLPARRATRADAAAVLRAE